MAKVEFCVGDKVRWLGEPILPYTTNNKIYTITKVDTGALWFDTDNGRNLCASPDRFEVVARMIVDIGSFFD